MSAAAEMAGKWWADRLDERHADKREAFAAAVSTRIDDQFSGRAYWDWSGRSEGDGKGTKVVRTSCDYDPQGLLLEAVREVIDPKCRGSMFSADGILPTKHGLDVYADHLRPKEGYGNWTEKIPVVTEHA